MERLGLFVTKVTSRKKYIHSSSESYFHINCKLIWSRSGQITLSPRNSELFSIFFLKNAFFDKKPLWKNDSIFSKNAFRNSSSFFFVLRRRSQSWFTLWKTNVKSEPFQFHLLKVITFFECTVQFLKKFFKMFMFFKKFFKK